MYSYKIWDGCYDRVSLDISQLKKAAEQEGILKRDLSEGPVKVTVYDTDGNKISFDGKDHLELEGGKLVMTPHFDWIG